MMRVSLQFPMSSFFLDLNRDGSAGNDEPTTRTDSAGFYSFPQIPAFRNHSIRVNPPIGFELTGSGSEQSSGIELFLPAGAEIPNLDFAMRRIQSSGQSSASSVTVGCLMTKTTTRYSMKETFLTPIAKSISMLRISESAIPTNLAFLRCKWFLFNWRTQLT